MDPENTNHHKRDAAMREVMEIWQSQCGTHPSRVELAKSDAIRTLSGRLRRAGPATLIHALAHQSQRGTPTPESWLKCYDRLYHPTPQPRRGISDDDVPWRKSGTSTPPAGGIAASSLG